MPPKAQKVADDYSHGDIVLAKVKGYPPWPGQIIPDAEGPPNVLRIKPKGKTHLVLFFPTGEYAWTLPRDLSALSTREIESYVSTPHRKNGDLLEGYKIAKNPTEWKKEKADQIAEGTGEDELDSGGEEKSGKKRKRKDEGKSGAAAKKGKQEDGEKDSKKKKTEKVVKSKASTASKKAVHSEDEATGTEKKSKATSGDGMKQVKDWRHKLQRVFLGKDGNIVVNEVPKCKEYFDAMENFEMKAEWLVESKLAKVLKRISQMDASKIPNESEYQFAQRSRDIANKWADLLPGGSGTPAPEKPSGSKNGVKEDKKPASSTAATEEKPKEAEEDKMAVDKEAVEESPKEDAKPKENGVNGDAAPAPAPAGEEKMEGVTTEEKKDESAPAPGEA
ncbi:hypothetical protein MNV49_007008 [Pseudohyphozyma bogoriensis]|nr:hypothetical protein MNV49_007008 [Pseudohyphozyma bogoriensis]